MEALLAHILLCGMSVCLCIDTNYHIFLNITHNYLIPPALQVPPSYVAEQQ